jgi:hypothetical protein
VEKDATIALDPPLKGDRSDFLRGADKKIVRYRSGGRGSHRDDKRTRSFWTKSRQDTRRTVTVSSLTAIASARPSRSGPTRCKLRVNRLSETSVPAVATHDPPRRSPPQ